MANDLGHGNTMKFKKGSAAFSINQSSIIKSTQGSTNPLDTELVIKYRNT
jgi:hypothetical protein